jgi:hypothetical protein
VSKLRSLLYRSARTLGDIEAAEKGPAAYARRRIRRKGYAGWNRIFRRMTKGL